MPKSKNLAPVQEDKYQWQAEDMVRQLYAAQPRFKKNVARVKKELKRLERVIKP